MHVRRFDTDAADSQEAFVLCNQKRPALLHETQSQSRKVVGLRRVSCAGNALAVHCFRNPTFWVSGIFPVFFSRQR